MKKLLRDEVFKVVLELLKKTIVNTRIFITSMFIFYLNKQIFEVVFTIQQYSFILF